MGNRRSTSSVQKCYGSRVSYRKIQKIFKRIERL